MAFLALMLVLTSQAMAVARGSSGPAGQMTLCTGTGPSQIYVDQNGTPTGPPVYCPDCALANLAVFATQPQFLTFEFASTTVEFTSTRMGLQKSSKPQHSRARAPPLVV